MHLNIIVFLTLFFGLCFIVSGDYLKCPAQKGAAFTRGYEAYIFLSFLIFFVAFYVLRDFSYAHDTSAYVSVYNQIALRMNSITEHNIARGWERGFIILLYLLSRISDNARFFLFVVSCLIYGSFLRFIFQCNALTSEKNVIYSVMLFVLHGTFFSSTNLMRQFLATSIILYSYMYLADKKYMRFYALVLLAFLFHSTAIICIMLPFVRLFKPTKKFVRLYLLGIILLVVFGVKILEIGVHIIAPRYEGYLNSAMYGIQNTAKLGPLLNLGVGGLLLILFYKNLDLNNRIQVLLFEIFMAGLVFTAMSAKFTQIGRISGYFFPAALPLFAMARKDGLFYFSLFSLTGYCLVVNIFRPEWTAFFPYHFA